MTETVEVARDFTALLAAGKLQSATNRYWAQDIAMVCPAKNRTGLPIVVAGFDHAQRKLAAWLRTRMLADITIDGPFVTGTSFALFLDLDIVRNATGQHEAFSEIAVYTVLEGKISEERHFHGTWSLAAAFHV